MLAVIFSALITFIDKRIVNVSMPYKLAVKPPIKLKIRWPIASDISMAKILYKMFKRFTYNLATVSITSWRNHI